MWQVIPLPPFLFFPCLTRCVFKWKERRQKSCTHLPHQMECKTARCWHLYPERRPSGSPPQLARCRCGSTGCSRRTCQYRSRQDLVEKEKWGNSGRILSLENSIILKTILKKIFFLMLPIKKKKLPTLVILMSHYLAPPVVKTNSEAGAIWLHVAFCAMVPVNSSDTDRPSDVHQTIQFHFYLNKVSSVNILYLKTDQWE